MRYAFLLLACLALMSCVHTSQTLDGTFLNVEEGDYFHLNVADAQGKKRSFFILGADSSFDPFIENPGQYAGRKVRVTWKESEEDIPEAGGKMTIESASRIELLK